MKAELLLSVRDEAGEDGFADIRIWRVPHSVRGSNHFYKYALALVINEECVLRYDNEAGKGDHRHVLDKEESYRFESIETLIEDFWKDVDGWQSRT